MSPVSSTASYKNGLSAAGYYHHDLRGEALLCQELPVEQCIISCVCVANELLTQS